MQNFPSKKENKFQASVPNAEDAETGGGDPIRPTFLPFHRPDIDQTDIDEVVDSLKSGWLTTGPKVKRFEAEFADYVGAAHAVAVNSCTAALHLALEAIGLQSGDEVITSTYTFAATAEVIRYFGARPVFVDIQSSDFNIDPALIEDAVTPHTRAIIPVHIAGLPCDLDPIYAIAKHHNLVVIEDAAHAFPASYGGHPIGASTYADQQSAVCFSFYATKAITTGEGGMITTDDERIADRCRIMALHGISKDAWKRYTAEGSWYYEIVAPGYKYNLTDLAAALGLAQLQKADRMWQDRREIALQYNQALQDIPQFDVPSEYPNRQHAWHLYILKLNLDQMTIDRDQFVQELKTQNIGTSVHYIPLHLHPYYRDLYGYEPDDFPVALGEYERACSLPIYPTMSRQDVDDVIGAVLRVTKKCI